MKNKNPLLLLSAALMIPPLTGVSEAGQWTFDASLYGLAVSMSGDIGIGHVNADIDAGFDKVLDNLEFGAMGTLRLGYDRWALTTDIIYMGLQGSKNGVTAEFDQWMVEPTLSYRVSDYFEVLAGVRYNNLSGEIRGPGVLPTPRIPSGTQDWWDPIVGARSSIPLGKVFSFNLRGDIGGFGVGSDLTWQVFPYFGWRFAQWGSAELGYRWVYMDYETGSGSNRFAYDMLNQGLQIGFTIHF
ncbi:MAG: hypothetical protein GX456_01405 [Verrucomicrobia bacterium]|nr:hypothetical protein [Verrucomicrobiota bacterium]